MSETTTMKSLNWKDGLREELRGSLFHCFLREGYDSKECAKLTDIAIGPVSQALDLAQAAYNLHVEAVNLALPQPIFLREASHD